MENPAQKVTRLISEACARYPGGLHEVFKVIQEKGGKKRSSSTSYADFNPNPTSLGSLKIADFMQALEITGSHEALRYMAAYFGYSLIGLASVEPDAPTVEAEMLQDYPAVVAFHEAVKNYRAGEGDYETVLAKMEAVTTDLRQTASLARKDIFGE